MDVKSTFNTSRLEAKASQIINKRMITAERDTREPREEMVFHMAYASG